jgi:predicted nucleic-acid-binding protein
MTGLDTNVLARYYVEDASDMHTRRQREAARALMESGRPLMVCKTVILELEWVLRGYYRFNSEEIATVLAHLIAMPNLTIEDREAVEKAWRAIGQGFDFADALRHASYGACERVATFDDRRFARRAERHSFLPPVEVLS